MSINNQNLVFGIAFFVLVLIAIFTLTDNDRKQFYTGTGTNFQSYDAGNNSFPDSRPNIETEGHVTIGPQGFYQFCKDHKGDADKCFGN